MVKCKQCKKECEMIFHNENITLKQALNEMKKVRCDFPGKKKFQFYFNEVKK